MQRLQTRPLATALLCAGLLTVGAAQAQSGPEFKFSGFGTLAVTHADTHDADFVTTIFEPNGAGRARSTTGNTDSKLGGQVDVVFNDRWSAVVQLVAQHHHNNSFEPQVEWANVKFRATPELSVRVGRIAAPSFLVSDTRYVGYAQPWVRPPVEVYGVLPITSNDGVDAIYKHQMGSVTNTFQAYIGQSTGKLKTGSAKSKPSWGLNDSVQWGDLTLRAGYSANEVDLKFPTIGALVNGIGALSALPAPFGPQAAALAQKYSVNDMKLGAFSLAASYDPGQWFVMSEFVDFKGDGILVDSRSWYATGGYRFGAVTPYLTYARTKSSVETEAGIGVPAAAPLNAGLNSALRNQFNGSQATISGGVRWDFMKNMALKAQYDQIRLDSGSAGRLANVQPAFVRGSKVDVVTVALDFVF